MPSAGLIFPPEYVAKLKPLTRGESSCAANLALRKTPGIARLRETLEAWVAELPALLEGPQKKPMQEIAIERLRGDDDVQHLATQYEVLLYGYFRSLGYAVTPNAPTGDGRDIDLLVQKDGCYFYVEVATIGPTVSGRERRARERTLLLGINDVEDPNYLAEVFVSCGDSPTLTRKEVRHLVHEHLYRMQRGEIPAGQDLRIGTVQVRFRPGLPSYGFLGTTVRPLDRAYLSQVPGRLKEKCDRFGALKDSGVPYVVALCDGGVERSFQYALEEVLMGGSREGSPFLSSDKNTRLSAVLGCEKYNRDDGLYLNLNLWHNPSAANPFLMGCLPDIAHVWVTFGGDGSRTADWIGDKRAEVRVALPS